MTTIGIIGAGHIGSQIAQLAVENGYNVVISNSRGPETSSALIAELGPKAHAATAVEAAKAGDIVVVSVPLKNYQKVPVDSLTGKIVIDTDNYYPERDGHIPSSTTSRPPRRNCCRPTCQPRKSSRPSTIFMPLPLLLTDSQPAQKIAARWSSPVMTKMPKPE